MVADPTANTGDRPARSIRTIIDWSTFPGSDGEPMAETIENQVQMVNLQFAFRHLLESQGRTQWAVGGNQLMYYNEQSGLDHCSPDVYVALDVLPGLRPIWQTWIEGKFPDIVFEISSPSTDDTDLDIKPDLYARLGVKEYYIYDPQQAMRPPLRAYRRVGSRLVSVPLLRAGGIRSPLLRVELRPIGQYLRVIDPESGEPLPMVEEVRQAWLDAEERAQREEQARRAAEERAAQAEAALQAALAALARRDRAGNGGEDSL